MDALRKVKADAELRIVQQEERINILNGAVESLKMQLEEVSARNVENLKLQSMKLEIECTEKLSELKKKAEFRFKQIKSQVQADKKKAVDETEQIDCRLERSTNECKRRK